MSYKAYHIRSPDTPTFLADAKAAIESAGIDPYEKGLLFRDENGDDVAGQGVDVIPAGRWYITEPVYDVIGELTDPGVKGDYALINVRTEDPEVQAVIEGFEPSDADKQPSEIPVEQTIGGGTHRVDGDTIDSPVRQFATVEE